MSRIIITGAAGLVGQNLVLELVQQGYGDIVAIDKHAENLATLQQLNPQVKTIHADLAESGAWESAFSADDIVVILHAQITGLNSSDFDRNNLAATQRLLAVLKKNPPRYTVQISSSVVNSVADDDYTRTKRAQEQLFLSSDLPGCVLRPTLMFGWFDPKHLGWLSRLMTKLPVFPIPGHGRYLRQPLYCRDFCRIIIAAIQQQPNRTSFDIVGMEKIDYIDMIRLIKRVKELKTIIVKLPYRFFRSVMALYAKFSSKPPFTVDQLTALTAGDVFTGIDYQQVFGIEPTPLTTAFTETFCHPVYSKVLIKR